ncbi:uncharacterized protein B0H18DRAFT_630659 [Fomitopsis serialis]|uniref:uncharacterized protein n=1 Tax=Fomitopsis serialis TaxID=139415 RepID=UPI00200848DD|nr:uncharacterized protein B0H18DRAFT_630659 [Neoantrodia serialis]KAH9919635.1 hypothetical protein B0H18DRAFT_630659 [Neoantrodia serialis]
MIHKLLATDARAAVTRLRRQGLTFHPSTWPGPSTLIDLPPRRCAHTQAEQTTQTTATASDSAQSTSERIPQWLNPRHLVGDTLKHSRAYLPGPRGKDARSETDGEDELPDEDVAQDSEGNPAGKKVLIARLPKTTTLEDLMELLDGRGECLIHFTPPQPNNRRCYAHVLFRRLKDALAFMRAHNEQKLSLGSHKPRVLYSDTHDRGQLSEPVKVNRVLWVSNLPYDATMKQVRELFEPYGIVRRVSMTPTQRGKFAGYAHVDFEFIEDASAVMFANWHQHFELGGRRLWISPAKSITGAPSPAPIRSPAQDIRTIDEDGTHPTYPPCRVLWVGGLPRGTKWKHIRKIFRDHTEVVDIQLGMCSQLIR